MLGKTETITGYVVDLSCARSWSIDQLWERARKYSRECALKGTAIESGYALVQDDQTLVMLDPEATPLIVDAINLSGIEVGIRLRVERETVEGKMKTMLVTEI